MHESRVFLNDWLNADSATLARQFGIDSGRLAGVELLLASYAKDAYSGEAFVLFRLGRELFEINASHASTDGMEGQWEPEETLVAALRHRLQHGRLGLRENGENLFANELAFLLAELEAEGFR
jgi:hypothetical protein